MKKTSISKIIILIISFLLVACTFTQVLANDDIPSLDDDFNFTVPGGNDIENDLGNGLGNGIENSVGNDIGNGLENIGNNNASSYPDNNIPHAGIETSILAVSAFVICGIIGIYTFIKLSEYSNI